MVYFLGLGSADEREVHRASPEGAVFRPVRSAPGGRPRGRHGAHPLGPLHGRIPHRGGDLRARPHPGRRGAAGARVPPPGGRERPSGRPAALVAGRAAPHREVRAGGGGAPLRPPHGRGAPFPGPPPPGRVHRWPVPRRARPEPPRGPREGSPLPQAPSLRKAQGEQAHPRRVHPGPHGPGRRTAGSTLWWGGRRNWNG